MALNDIACTSNNPNVPLEQVNRVRRSKRVRMPIGFDYPMETVNSEAEGNPTEGLMETNIL